MSKKFPGDENKVIKEGGGTSRVGVAPEKGKRGHKGDRLLLHTSIFKCWQIPTGARLRLDEKSAHSFPHVS